MAKKVAIIGSGVSGLTAIKACLEEGLEPSCFEKSCDIGGLWRFTDEVEDNRASIYNSLVANVSKETMCFSDFPMPEDFPNFPPNHKYFEYIKLYAEHFHLTKYIQFKTSVVRVEKCPDFPVTGQWNVTTENDGVKKTAVFDAVYVCTGQHTDAEIPLDSLPGIRDFKGKVIHSREYKRPVGYDGKRVLIIGMGNSGVDISTELCTIASQIYLTTREGVWVIPRLGKDGYPYDLFLLRRIYNWIENIVPPSVSRWMLKRYLNERFNHELYSIQPEGIKWKLPLANDEIASRVLSGSIIIKPGVTKFTETDAHFSDGSIVKDLDVVILCTGFGYSFPFLDESVYKRDENKGNLYKKMIPLGIEKPTIAFITFVIPIGPVMVVAELQSRWFARLLKGFHKLPNVEGMKENLLKDEKLRQKWFGTSKNNFVRTDYISYIEDIAADIGVMPDILKLLLTDPVLAIKLVFGVYNSYQLRLIGPGKWDGAREAILTQWDRIERPLRTRIPKKKSTSLFTSYIILCLFFVTLLVALWLKG